MTLLEPHNLPFAIALIALAVIAVLQIIGAGDMFDGGDVDFDLDLDVDAAGELDAPDGLAAGSFLDGLLTLLGLGKVPFLVWVAMLLFVFAATGVIGQSIVASTFGSPFSAGFAALLAGVAAVPLNALAVRPLGILMPEDETSAVGIESLVRRDAQIQIGTATQGSPARSKVIDAFGHPHFVMVEPHDPSATLREGETVLLVRREGETFYGVRYESPLLTPE